MTVAPAAARLTPVRRAAVALLLALLLFGRQIASWTNARNRYLLHWQGQDSLVLVLGVALAALFLLAGAAALERWTPFRTRRLHELGFLILLLAVLLSQVTALSENVSPARASILWGVLLPLLLLTWRRFGSRTTAVALATCLVLSPLVPILAAQILLFRAVDTRERSPLAEPDPRAEATPIVLVVFDEWSQPRSVERGRYRAFLPHTAALAERSLVVWQAHAPSHTTRISLPRLLFQRGGEVKLRPKAAYLVEDGAWTPSRDVPSVFDRAREAGYRTVMLGYYFPYRDLLGDEVDRVVALPHEPRGRGLPGKLLLAVGRNLQYGTDPLSRLVWPPLYARLYSENWREVNERLRAELDDELQRTTSGNSFIVAHLPMPHAPFVYEADGTYRGPFAGDRMEGSAADYERHLRYADTVLGAIVAMLERAGTFERTLLVVTSDHSWKKEPDPALAGLAQADRRVPLIVKWPGQRTPLSDDIPFCTARLAPLLEAALGSGPPPALTPELWEALSAEGRSSTICGD